jgi:transcriptional regulator with XRE-family HTH domain
MENRDSRAERHAFANIVAAAFGAKLRQLRRARDLSQEDLALKVGISRPSVATVEAGRQNIQLHQVYQFARALDLPLEELLPSPAEVSQFQRLSHSAKQNRVLDIREQILVDAKAMLRMQFERGSYGTATDKTGD